MPTKIQREEEADAWRLSRLVIHRRRYIDGLRIDVRPLVSMAMPVIPGIVGTPITPVVLDIATATIASIAVSCEKRR
jgi:hypothetical protein